MNEEEIREKARQLRAAGASIEQVKQYLASKGFEAGAPPTDDTVEVEASYPERLATTILKGAQVIPGMKSVEALAGSLGSKLTDHPVSYSEAKSGLEEQTDRMKPGLGIAAQAVSSPVLAPIMALRGISALSPMAQGAAYGAADAALDYNPDETNFSRIARPVAGAAIGGLLTGAASGVAKFAKSPPGTTGKVLGKAFPRLKRAGEAWSEATAGAPPTVRPQIRLMDASPPKAEGFVGNTLANLIDAAPEPTPLAPRRAPALEELIAPAEQPHGLPNVVKATERYRTESGRLQQGPTKGQLEWRQADIAKRSAARQATQMGTAPVSDLSESDLLQMTLEHIRQGGTLKSAGDAIRMLITR